MGTKTVPAKPSELIILAINNLEDKDGSSSHDIVKFITNEYKMKAEDVSPRVQEALKRAITYGIISQKDGKYKLQDIPKQKHVETAEVITSSPTQDSKAPEPEKIKIPCIQKSKKRAAPKKAKKRKKAVMKASIKAPIRGSMRAAKEIKLQKRTTKKVCRRCQSKATYFPKE